MTRNTVLGIFCVLMISFCSAWSQARAGDEELSEILVGEDLRYVEVGGNYLWFATSSGVSRYDTDTKSWDSFTSKDGLISNEVNCIAVEWKEGVFRKNPTQRVWFGTDSGLSVYDMKSNEWQSYTVKDGLIANKIRVYFCTSRLDLGGNGARRKRLSTQERSLAVPFNVSRYRVSFGNCYLSRFRLCLDWHQ